MNCVFQDNPMGQSGLGLMYFYGKGVDQVWNVCWYLTYLKVFDRKIVGLDRSWLVDFIIWLLDTFWIIPSLKLYLPQSQNN